MQRKIRIIIISTLLPVIILTGAILYYKKTNRVILIINTEQVRNVHSGRISLCLKAECKINNHCIHWGDAFMLEKKLTDSKGIFRVTGHYTKITIDHGNAPMTQYSGKITRNCLTIDNIKVIEKLEE